jgi:hypothetical protein
MPSFEGARVASFASDRPDDEGHVLSRALYPPQTTAIEP